MTRWVKLAASFAALAAAGTAAVGAGNLGHGVRTVQLPAGALLDGGTYTPSGKLLVTLLDGNGSDPRAIRLVVMNDDGSAPRLIFAGRVPDRAKDNGLRFMVFADDRRVMLGDFILECSQPLARCEDAKLVPVVYPAEVADGAHIAHRWSEPIVAPDNRHYAWTTLLADYTALVFSGRLERRANDYAIVDARYISSNPGFRPDPAHPDGMLPDPVRGGEVKQFVRGGAAISLAGAIDTSLANSTVLDLATGTTEAVTGGPSYTETTIFSPDERLGMTMTTRFSPESDLAVLALVPRPHPLALQVGLNMFAYTYGVTGVRAGRAGNVGPALIDIAQSRASGSYRGISLAKERDWVFLSPMSWHPDGRKAAWPEVRRGTRQRRLRIVELPMHRPGPTVATLPTPPFGAFASSDLSAIPGLMTRGRAIDVKVYGRAAGHIVYRRAGGKIEKLYTAYSDDGRSTWSGSETTETKPRGMSRYSADLTLSGPRPGRMDLVMTFGPIGAPDHARLIFDADASGRPQTRGYARFGNQRIDVAGLRPKRSTRQPIQEKRP